MVAGLCARSIRHGSPLPFLSVDDVTRECLAAIPGASVSGRGVVRELTALVCRRGRPAMIVSDNGTEFTCTVILA